MKNIKANDLFPTDYTLDKSQLVGRDKDSKTLKKRIDNGVNTFISSPRRTGKSSLVESTLKEYENNNEFYIISLDLWSISSREDFAKALFANTVANQNLPRRIISKLKNQWNELDSTEITSLGEITANYIEGSITFEPSIQKDTNKLLKFAFSFPQAIAAKDNKQVILFFDEFQNFIEFDDDQKSLQKMLRTVLQDSPDVSAIFSGSIGSLMDKIFGDINSPLGRFGNALALTQISDEQWSDGIESKLKKANKKITQEAVTHLLSLTQGHPYATMLIMQHTYMNVVFEEKQIIKSDDISAGFRDAIESERDKHRLVIEKILNYGKKPGEKGIEILRRIATDKDIYAGLNKDSPESKMTSRILKKLELQGEIKRANKSWEIVNPLFNYFCKSDEGLY